MKRFKVARPEWRYPRSEWQMTCPDCTRVVGFYSSLEEAMKNAGVVGLVHTCPRPKQAEQ